MSAPPDQMDPTSPQRPKPPAADKTGRPLGMGVYGRHAEVQKISTIEIVAIALSVIWLLVVSYVYLTVDNTSTGPASPLDFMMTLLGVFLPVALIWVAASAARTARTMREESARLQAAIDGMRHAYVEQQQTAGMSIKRSMEERIETISRAQQRAEAVIAGLSATTTPAHSAQAAHAPAAHVPAPAQDDQPNLALGTPAEALPASEPLTMAEFVRAVNFPENEKDKEGFRTLRRALKDRTSSRLINAAQDVLTLMSQDGIYMDDLVPDRARPDVWRQFAQGERGRAIASLGGIRDRSSLALCMGRMRTDPVFKDAAHHFLRQFDRTLSQVEPHMSDVEISQMGNTRTARAFMLLGRVTGTFD